MSVRRSVLGDAHVDRAIANSTAFTEPFQDFITRTAWGDIWAREGLDHPTRRLLTRSRSSRPSVTSTNWTCTPGRTARGHGPELLVEVFLHTAVYAGCAEQQRAFALGKQALADLAGATEGST